MHFHASGPTTVRVKRTLLYTHVRRSWWGGVGGGMLTLLLIRTLSKCCYAAEISGVVATLCARRDGVWHVNVPATSYVTCCYTLQTSLVLLLLCRDLWCCCYVMCTKGWGWGGHVDVPANSDVICCYAAEISGVVATLQRCLALFATLQRSLLLLLRCVHEGVGWGEEHVKVPATLYVICC